MDTYGSDELFYKLSIESDGEEKLRNQGGNHLWRAMIMNHPNVKAFSNEELEESRYGVALDRFLKVTMDGAKARAAFVSFIIFVLFGTISLVVWFGAGMLVSGELSGEEFARFILFSVFVGASLGAFPEIVSQLQKTAGATERVKEILNEQPESTGGEVCESDLLGALSAEDLTFSYPSRPEVKVLDGINFEVKAGE